jgi:hypothetical protein
MQLKRTISSLPKLKGLIFYGFLETGGALKLESSSLTTLKIKSYGESILSDIRCPLLKNLKLSGPKHVCEDGPTILRRCHWLEQWEKLTEERIKEALKDSRRLTEVCSVAWASGRVVKIKKLYHLKTLYMGMQ